MWSKEFPVRAAGAAAVAAALLAGSCTDDTGPGRLVYGHFALEPVFVSEAAGIVPVSAGRFVLRRTADGSVVKDTVIALGAEADSVDLSLTVPMNSPSETFELTVALVDAAGDTVFRAGPLTVTPTVGAGAAPAVQLPVVYTGIGSDAATIVAQTADTAGLFGDELLLLAVALDSASQPIPNTPIEWRSLDSLRVRVARPDSGRVIVGTQRGPARIVARLLTDQADTIQVVSRARPNTIAVDGGNNQSGLPNQALPQPLVARVMAVDGPVDGVWVRFAVTGGTGSVAPESVLTDAQGRASVIYTLGSPGSAQAVTASTALLPSQSAVFAATVASQRATALALINGDQQTGTVATTLESAILVEAWDPNDAPVPGDTVLFLVLSGGGSVSADTVVTDGNGQVLTFWTLGPIAGDQEIQARLITGAATLDIHATALPAGATRLGFTVEPTGTAVSGVITPAPSVTAFDQFDNVVTGFAGPVTLTLLDNPGGSTLSGTTVVSATAGVATFADLSLNLPGTGYTLEARDTGLEADTSAAFDVLAPQGNVMWVATGGGGWSTGANWSSGAPPSPVDTALITLDGTYTVTLDVDATVARLVLGAPVGTQTLTIGGGRTFTVADAASIGPNGSLVVQGGTLDGPGGTVTNDGTILLASATLSDALVNNGLVVAQGTSALTGPLTTGPGSLLRLEANGTFGSAQLTVATGFTNTEAIELTNTSTGGFSSNLTVTTGTLVNQGTITVVSGLGGGPRTLDAAVDNQGTLDVQFSLGITNAGTTFTTTGGTLAVAAGQTLTVTNGTTVVGTGTTLVGTGTVALAGTHVWDLASEFTLPAAGVQWALGGSVTVNGPGVLVNQSTFTLTSDAVNADLTNEGTVVVQGTSTLGGALTTGAGSLLRLEANGTFGSAQLTVATGFTNTEIIELTNTSTGGFSSNLTVTTGTLVNQGTITVLAGPGGGPRTLDAELVNQGTLDVQFSLGITNAGTTLTTTAGTLAVATGQTLTVTNGTTVVGTGTTLIGTGTVNLGGTHVWTLASDFTIPSGGVQWTLGGSVTVNGPGVLVNQSAFSLTSDVVNANLTNEGTLETFGASSVNGALTTGTGSVLRVVGNGTLGSAQLTVATGFTNTESIELTTGSTGAFTATLALTAGTLTNQGTILATAGPGGGVRVLDAALDNQGTLDVQTPLGITNTGRSFTTATGTVNVAAGQTLTVTNGTTVVGTATTLTGTGTVNLAGAHTWTLGSDFTVPAAGVLWALGGSVTVNGPGALINQGTLTVTSDVVNAALTNDGTLAVQGTSQINGGFSNGGGSVLRAEGSNTLGSAALTVAAGFTNAGSIEMTNAGTGAFQTTITMTTGTLVNQGTISVLPGVGGGARVLTGALDNQGTLSVNANFTTNAGGLTFSPGSVLQGAATANLSASPSLLVGGEIRPGTSPGLLGIVRSPFIWSGTATLSVELGGTTPGAEYDQLNVTGGLSLLNLGTLDVTLINGFTPAQGQQFTILTYASVTGDFAQVNLPALPPPLVWQRAINATSMVLAVTGPAPQIVFAGDSAGRSIGVFRVNGDSSGLFNVTPEGASGATPRWSPDRTRIAYSARAVFQDPNQLHVISADGGTPAHLTGLIDTSTWFPRYNPTGKHLAFECGDRFSQVDVCVIPNVDGPIASLGGIGNGAGKVFVTDFDLTGHPFGPGAFAWDPATQDRLAFVREDGQGLSQIFTSLFDGSDVQALSAAVLDAGGGPLTIVDRMDWSPDGSRLAFVAQDTDVGANKLYLINRDGSGLTQLTTGPDSDTNPVFSPDGQTVLFRRDKSCSSDLWRIDVSGANETQVTNDQVCDFSTEILGYDWSPDGSEIVLSAFETFGNIFIYVIPATTTAAEYFTVRRVVARGADGPSLVQDIEPSWRP